MNKIKLGEIAILITKGTTPTTLGYQFVESGVNFVKIESISENGEFLVDKFAHISEECDKKLKRSQLAENDILFSIAGAIGRTAIVPKAILPANTNQALAIIRIPTDRINLHFVLYALQSQAVTEQSEKQKQGVAQLNLSLQNIADIQIPYVSREEQDKIVRNLTALDTIIAQRKEQLTLMDQLVKSRFIEMFGNCENTVRLGECCEVHARIGWQALTKDEHMKTGEYMLVTGTDFKDGEINCSTCVYVAKERYEMDKHIILKNDDVLITKDGTIGKVSIVHNLPKPATLNAGVFVVRPDSRFNKEYIANVFKGPLFSDYVEASKTGATIKHLNQKHLVEFMIPVPTLEEQEAFAKFAQQTDKSKYYCVLALKTIKKLLAEVKL